MVQDYDDLRIYQEAHASAIEIFELSKTWPKEERYSLTSQVRRSARSVSANIGEAWGKRRYERHFVSKLSDAEAEAIETLTWLRHAYDCGYLSEEDSSALRTQYRKIRGGLIKMMVAPESWCGPSMLREPSVDYETD